LIVLDTNVISEPTKPSANERVGVWLNSQARPDLYITAISVSEMLQGLALLPEGARKRRLEVQVQEIISGYIWNPVLAFDEAAAVASAEIVLRAKAKRYTLGFGDAQIAAIALVHQATVATRDV